MATKVASAAVVLLRISFLLGFLAFVTGLVGFIVAVAGVHTGKVSRVSMPVYPVAAREFPVSHPVEEDRVELQPRKPSSKFSFDLSTAPT